MYGCTDGEACDVRNSKEDDADLRKKFSPGRWETLRAINFAYFSISINFFAEVFEL